MKSALSHDDSMLGGARIPKKKNPEIPAFFPIKHRQIRENGEFSIGAGLRISFGLFQGEQLQNETTTMEEVNKGRGIKVKT